MMVSAAELWLEYMDKCFRCDFVMVDGELMPVKRSAIEFIMYCITRVHEVWPEEIQACVPDHRRGFSQGASRDLGRAGRTAQAAHREVNTYIAVGQQAGGFFLLREDDNDGC
ncbi:hypothetical protein U5A82_06025 [Sphingobium sp. CR2-8]|uniref:hypothetical protein n=1 Tax=Sphingobium sp. CR2-8 TaxID=1306534 RepID=UPI002DBD3D8B|nr:hypothetical protein [Sphingobium sp. CR2-8]MEC3910047.1 hypothetical protein [Sphingobium sp. CR2-8]